MIGAASYAVWIVLYHFNVLNPGAEGSSPYYIWLFALGMASARAIFKRESPVTSNDVHSAWLKMALLSVVSIAAVIAVRKFVPTHATAQVQSAFVGLWTAVLLYCLGITEKIGLNYGKTSRSIAKLGVFAYSLYLIHPILVQLIWQWIFIPIGWTGDSSILGMVIVSAVLIPPIAYVFYLLFERPFHNMSRQIGRSKAHVVPIPESSGSGLQT